MLSGSERTGRLPPFFRHTRSSPEGGSRAGCTQLYPQWSACTANVSAMAQAGPGVRPAGAGVRPPIVVAAAHALGREAQ